MSKKKVAVAKAASVKEAAPIKEDAPAHPAPVEGSVVPDPLAPVAQVRTKHDIAIRVPRSPGRQYGLVDAEGTQIIHDVHGHDDVPEGGVVFVHPDLVDKFLRGVEGSRLLKARELTPEQEEIEAARPQGRAPLPPLTREEVEAAHVGRKARLAREGANPSTGSGATTATVTTAKSSKAPAKKA